MLFLPALATTGRVTGNQLMRMHCYRMVKYLQKKSVNQSGFYFDKLSNEDRSDVILLGWKSDLWVKTNFTFAFSEVKREVVVVCGKEFDNVHKPGFVNSFFRNPAHAVGYSDGKSGLISVEEFTNFNFSSFVSLANLATNSESGIFH